MGGLNFIFDGSKWVKAYLAGMEDMFIMLNDFEELNELLNVNKIEYGKEEK